MLALFSACGPAPTPAITPRPTLEPRTSPTPLPTPVDAGEVLPGQPLEVTLPGGTFVVLSYPVPTTQTIDIRVRALSDDGAGNVLDPVVEILDASANQVAYADDVGPGTAGLAASDAQITGLRLEPGQYQVRLNAFNGFQQGTLEVLITEISAD